MHTLQYVHRPITRSQSTRAESKLQCKPLKLVDRGFHSVHVFKLKYLFHVCCMSRKLSCLLLVCLFGVWCVVFLLCRVVFCLSFECELSDRFDDGSIRVWPNRL